MNKFNNYFIGVDSSGMRNDFATCIVMKRVDIKTIEVVEEYSIRIDSLSDENKFYKQVDSLSKKYNAIKLY